MHSTKNINDGKKFEGIEEEPENNIRRMGVEDLLTSGAVRRNVSLLLAAVPLAQHRYVVRPRPR